MRLGIAVTGGTGFIGDHFLRLAARHHDIRALTRRPRAARPNVEWVSGDLGRRDALAALVDGVDAVVHLAGVVNAPNRAGFAAGNVAGTLAVVEAMRAAGTRRLVHVSSLAAREPGLSDYGWSKARSEEVVRASLADWTIVRPPAVYGAGDREMLALFRMARRRLVLLPPAGRLSVIAVEDLARLLLALAIRPDGGHALYEPDDGRQDGRSHAQFARLLGNAVGRRGIALALSPAMLRLGARLDARLHGADARLTPDRVRYFCHPDWVARADAQPPAELWLPEIALPAGLLETVQWYRAARWL